MSEIEASIETIRMRAIRRPIALEVDAEFKRVLVADQREIVQEVETLVPLMIRITRISPNTRAGRNVAEIRTRHDVVLVGGWIELS